MNKYTNYNLCKLEKKWIWYENVRIILKNFIHKYIKDTFKWIVIVKESVYW